MSGSPTQRGVPDGARRVSAIIGTDFLRGTAIALFLLKRLASLLITLAVASVVVFAVLDLLPGNVAQVMLGERTPRRWPRFE